MPSDPNTRFRIIDLSLVSTDSTKYSEFSSVINLAPTDNSRRWDAGVDPVTSVYSSLSRTYLILL